MNWIHLCASGTPAASAKPSRLLLALGNPKAFTCVPLQRHLRKYTRATKRCAAYSAGCELLPQVHLHCKVGTEAQQLYSSRRSDTAPGLCEYSKAHIFPLGINAKRSLSEPVLTQQLAVPSPGTRNPLNNLPRLTTRAFLQKRKQ